MAPVYTETPTSGIVTPAATPALTSQAVAVSASERAYRQLRDEILDGVLAPGAGLLEVEQSDRIGVSRTPLRAAIARLIADGLVAGRAGRGFMVTEMSVDSIHELYEFRRALEEHASRIAATRRDPLVFLQLREQFRAAPELLLHGEDGLHRYYELIDDFDHAVDAAVGNPFLVAALASVRTHLARIRRLARHNPGRLRAAAVEHLLIIDAIIVGDSSLAAHATHVHRHPSLSNVLASLESNPAATVD